MIDYNPVSKIGIQESIVIEINEQTKKWGERENSKVECQLINIKNKTTGIKTSPFKRK